MRRRVVVALFIAYCFFLSWLTILSRHPRSGNRIVIWQLLWSYRAWISGEPYGKTESIQNINNILAFIPYGLLFPKKNRKILLLSAIAFSSSIETIQYLFNLGWCELDDVICNTLGAAIGFWLWLRIIKLDLKWRSKWNEY